MRRGLRKLRRRIAMTMLRMAEALVGYRPSKTTDPPFVVTQVDDEDLPIVTLPPWGRIVVKPSVHMGVPGHLVAVIRPGDKGGVLRGFWTDVHPDVWDLDNLATALNVPTDDLWKAVRAL